MIVVDISPISVPRSTGEMTEIFDAMVSLDLSPSMSMSEGRKIAREKLLKATEDETVDFIMLNLEKILTPARKFATYVFGLFWEPL